MTIYTSHAVQWVMLLWGLAVACFPRTSLLACLCSPCIHSQEIGSACAGGSVFCALGLLFLRARSLYQVSVWQTRQDAYVSSAPLLPAAARTKVISRRNTIASQKIVSEMSCVSTRINIEN